MGDRRHGASICKFISINCVIKRYKFVVTYCYPREEVGCIPPDDFWDFPTYATSRMWRYYA